ncbi:hypothetical protein L0128_21405, partial [candidate division KSB1 bacterium]|nr:hypothetical protein [candidate division KSB1 bacterium]
ESVGKVSLFNLAFKMDLMVIMLPFNHSAIKIIFVIQSLTEFLIIQAIGTMHFDKILKDLRQVSRRSI